jgi:hypothetical protein
MMIELDKFPKEIQEKVKNNLQKYGEWPTTHFLQMAPFEKMLEELNPSDTDFVWFIVTLHLLNLFGSKDPLTVHFTNAREHLKSLGIENDRATDVLSRALVIECQNLREFIFKKFSVNNLSLSIDGAIVAKLGPENGCLVPSKDAQPNFICTKDECNAIDLAFSEFLEKIGISGHEMSSLIKETAPKRYRKYIDSKFNMKNRQEAWSVWISKEPSQTLHLSPFLSILTSVVWNDKCKLKWEREKKNIPALTQGSLIKTIKPALSKNNRIEITNESTITCYSESGSVVSSVAYLEPKIMPMVYKGMECLPTLSGHKLIRWEIKTGFNNWLNGSKDPRLISTSGGYEGIANLIGCGNCNRSISEIKAMLHAQAYGQFEFPQGGRGNMIILREIEKHRNGNPSKINIILGDFLLPNFTHLLPQGDKRRLVPITDLPPLIGSANTHAAQAMLQLLILEEFSQQSDRIATKGSIILPKVKLEELASQAKLPKSSLEKVITGWTEDDLFSKAFLKRYGDEYTLGQEYSNVTNFLEQQGKQRIGGAKGGEKSAAMKKLKQKRLSH